jgi:hypothetical protein
MSFVSMVFVALGVLLLLALLLIAAALFSPLIFTLDSGTWQVRIRWLAAFEYWRPLPGGRGETGLSIAGKSIGLPARGAKEKHKRAVGAARKPRRDRARAARFLRRCLGEPSVRRTVTKRLGALWRGLLRSVSVTRRKITVSLPDPAWNGMLAGGLAWLHGSRGSAIRVDFTGKSSALLEVRLYPYRIAKVLLVILMGLPYRALYRAWRASSATASG